MSSRSIKEKTTTKIIFTSSKVQISTEEKPDGSKVFRLKIDYMGRTMHANVSSQEAYDISDAIYKELPDYESMEPSQ